MNKAKINSKLAAALLATMLMLTLNACSDSSDNFYSNISVTCLFSIYNENVQQYWLCDTFSNEQECNALTPIAEGESYIGIDYELVDSCENYRNPYYEWEPLPGFSNVSSFIEFMDSKPKHPFANSENFNPGNPPSPDYSVPAGSVNNGQGKFPAEGLIPGLNLVWVPNINAMAPVSNIVGNGTQGDVHGFGTGDIPPQRAGELILTAFPNAYGPTGNPQYPTYEEWMMARNEGQTDLFGLPPVARGGSEWWGLTNPMAQADPLGDGSGGGFAFVKNGFPNESSTKGTIRMAPTRCTAVIDPGGAKGKRANVNCISLNMIVLQPFQLAVTVYDQLGNFVTQYRETVTEQEFRNVTQASSFLPGAAIPLATAAGCDKPDFAGEGNYGSPTTMTLNGQVNVSVNIYPLSSTGKRFGNGVYTVKVDRVDLPFQGCNYFGGGFDYSSMPFGRRLAEGRFNWITE